MGGSHGGGHIRSNRTRIVSSYPPVAGDGDGCQVSVTARTIPETDRRAFGTDFQVPTPTAAFLSKTSNYIHERLPDKKDYLLSVQTEVTEVYDRDDASQCLDALGWTKVFLDVRREIPLPSIPLLFAEEPIVPADRELWTSYQLRETMIQRGKTWKLPLGHMVSCANSRDRFNRWMNSRGQPFMDQLALDLLELMSETASSNSQECVIAE